MAPCENCCQVSVLHREFAEAYQLAAWKSNMEQKPTSWPVYPPTEEKSGVITIPVKTGLLSELVPREISDIGKHYTST